MMLSGEREQTILSQLERTLIQILQEFELLPHKPECLCCLWWWWWRWWWWLVHVTWQRRTMCDSHLKKALGHQLRGVNVAESAVTIVHPVEYKINVTHMEARSTIREISKIRK